MANIYREIKYTLGTSCNKKIIREKSVKNKIKCKQTQRIKNWAQKSQANLMWLRLRLYRA